MPDMLVNLYNLPSAGELTGRLDKEGVRIIRAMTPNKRLVCDWIGKKFAAGWASECEAAFCHFPVSCFAAVKGDEIIGFACYDATMKGYFGPMGVDPDARERGVGTALLLNCLEAMKNEGYGYAVIGGAGPVDFYRKACGATVIDGSSPNIYTNLLRG